MGISKTRHSGRMLVFVFFAGSAAEMHTETNLIHYNSCTINSYTVSQTL